MATRVNIQPEHVAQALHEPALGRQQQDHRRERDGLEGDHEPDQEQVKQHSAPPVGQVGPNLHGTRRRERDSVPAPHDQRTVNADTTDTQRNATHNGTTTDDNGWTRTPDGSADARPTKPSTRGGSPSDHHASTASPVAVRPSHLWPYATVSPTAAATYSAGDKRTRSRRGLGTQPTMKRPFPVRDRAGSVEGELQRRRPSSMPQIMAGTACRA